MFLLFLIEALIPYSAAWGIPEPVRDRFILLPAPRDRRLTSVDGSILVSASAI